MTDCLAVITGATSGIGAPWWVGRIRISTTSPTLPQRHQLRVRFSSLTIALTKFNLPNPLVARIECKSLR